jgi:hypothetical protein
MGLHFAYNRLPSSYTIDDRDYKPDALAFIRHCHNDQTINDLNLFDFPGNDGGLTYNPEGTSPFDDPFRESWASMTYAGIWSYTLLGLDWRDPGPDPEMTKALSWIGTNYSVDYNPPIQTLSEAETCSDPGNFALYYYYATMSKALVMANVPSINGNDWKKDLTKKLSTLQNHDGSWVNTCTREWEGYPELCTAYALLALQAFQDPPSTYWMEVILNSPADLVVYDPQGNSCSKYKCNIPGAISSDPPQTVTLNELRSGHYRFEIIGTGDGPVTITTNGYRGDKPNEERINQIVETFTIAKDDVWEADVVVSSLVGPLTIDMVNAFCYPFANAGLDQTVSADDNCMASVTLSGSGSTDCDSSLGTNDDIVSFEWYEEEASLGSGETLVAGFPLGTHTVTLEVTDSQGNTNSDEVIITVEDTTPPEISVSVSPDTLWPPNHKMVLITPTITATDNCDPDPDVTLISITMNEGEETNTFDPNYDSTQGDGHTINDIHVDEYGNIYLRAERAGKGSGRIYTIIYTATDSGNSATTSATVTVPHNQ